MSERFFNMPFVITGLRFHDGRSYPSRIDVGGRVLYPDTPNSDNLVSFYHNERHYWLERHGRSWRWLSV